MINKVTRPDSIGSSVCFFQSSCRFSLHRDVDPVHVSSLLVSSDIDECADGFVECDSKSTCVNLPGWYHCECRDGYHDNGLFSTNGESCVGE